MEGRARTRGKTETEGRDTPEEKGKRRQARENKVQANLDDPKENRKVGDPDDSAGRAARSDTRQQHVDGESPTSMRKMQTAEKAEDNVNQKKIEKSEECGSSGMCRRSRRRGDPRVSHTP